MTEPRLAPRRLRPGLHALPAPGDLPRGDARALPGLLGPSGALLRRPAGARCCIVGLAPGMHGANRTGRPFTGDHAGILLYQSLCRRRAWRAAPASVSSEDGLCSSGARASSMPSSACRRRTSRCRRRSAPATPTLGREMRELGAVRVFLALGRVAHEAVLLAHGLPRTRYAFAHASGTPPERCAAPDRLLSLQPLQHPDAAPDRAHVPRRAGARLRARRAAGAGGPQRA